jgi:hypothetical protein
LRSEAAFRSVVLSAGKATALLQCVASAYNHRLGGCHAVSCIAEKENVSLKGFLISLLAAGAALVLAGLLWTGGSPPAAERLVRPRPHFGLDAAPVEKWHVEQVPEYHNVPAMPRHSAVPGEQAGAAPVRASTNEVSSSPTAPHVNAEKLTLKQTATSDTSLRNADFPLTYISSIRVDLTSPNHSVRLTWSGPKAGSQESGPFHSSPGRGLGYNNCDDVAESCRADSNCTPKGTLHVQAFSETMTTSPECRFVTWFQTARGIAFHYYPNVPNYPASHGCVRLEDMRAAQLIHNNSKIGATEVTIDGKWTFVR